MCRPEKSSSSSDSSPFSSGRLSKLGAISAVVGDKALRLTLSIPESRYVERRGIYSN